MTRASQLRAFIAQDPSNVVLLCELLDELLGEGLPDEAAAQLESAPAEVRTLPAVRFREARCAMMQRNFSAAVALLQPLVDGADAVPTGMAHDLAYAHFALGHLDQAMQRLSGVRAEGDEAVAVALLKARILHHHQLFAEALETLAAFDSPIRRAEVLGLRSMLLLDNGDATGAAIAASQALAIDPSQYEAVITAGTVALWEQRLDESQVMFEQALRTDPGSGRALLGLGQNQMLRADVPAARASLERALAGMPGHIGTWHALAWCQLLEGDLAGAAHSFDRAFAIDRTFGETHGGVALVHALRGERVAAEESIRRAMRLDPDGSAARYARSVLLLDDGQPDEARKVVDGILMSSSGRTMGVPPDFIFRLRELVRPRG